MGGPSGPEQHPLLGGGGGAGGLRHKHVARAFFLCAAVAAVAIVALGPRASGPAALFQRPGLHPVPAARSQKLVYRDWRGTSLEAVDGFSFTHTWEGSVDVGEREQHVVAAPALVLAADAADVAAPLGEDASLRTSLKEDYGISLAGTWTSGEASALSETLKDLCEKTDEISGTPRENCALGEHTTVRVMSLAIVDDVRLSAGQIALSKSAFKLAGEKGATLDGKTGSVGSLRLQFALVKALTRFGQEKAVVGQLLQRKFAATLQVDGDGRPGYIELTKPTTLEDDQRFQHFKSPELLFMLEAWSLMPGHMHKVDGLRYVTRRQQGLYHPYYGATTAVSWPENQPVSYQEYMDYSFNQDGYTSRHLFIHEKSHFFWAKQFDTQLKERWEAAGRWAETRNTGEWMTPRTTSFSSDYGASNNPDEDMAECMAAYVLHPTTLQARSPKKDQFLADDVFKGVRYVEQPELAFEVDNDEPYLRYPAAVKHVSINAAGSPADDKDVKIEMLVDVGRGWHSASHAEVSLSGPTSGSKTITLHAEKNTDGEEIVVDEDSDNEEERLIKLVYEGKFDKHLEAGFWSASQVKVIDKLGHERWIRIDEYSWRLYLNNKEGTAWAPRYVKNSMKLKLETGKDEATDQEHPVVKATIRFEETGAPMPEDDTAVWMRLASKAQRPGLETDGKLLDQDNWMEHGASEFAYPVYQTGKCVKDENSYRGTCTVSWKLSAHAPAGAYYVSMVNLADVAGNTRRQFFTQQKEGWTCCGRVGNTPDDEFPVAVALPECAKGASLSAAAPCVQSDITPPELDRTSLAAKVERDAGGKGKGEAVITFRARDAGAGVGTIGYRVMDPQGMSHAGYVKHDNAYGPAFKGDPAAWAEYELRFALPRGSPPGRWMLESLDIHDKAGNQKHHQMVEIAVFRPGAAEEGAGAPAAPPAAAPARRRVGAGTGDASSSGAGNEAGDGADSGAAFPPSADDNAAEAAAPAGSDGEVASADNGDEVPSVDDEDQDDDGASIPIALS